MIKKILWGFLLYPFCVNAGDGTIRFYTYYLKESKSITYKKDGKISHKSLKEISQLLRSRDSGNEMSLDPQLVELLDDIEDHFQVRQVEIISGYRSREFNQNLKKSGHRVANESYHTKGMASDIHLDEITEEDVRDYALSLKRGGVGYYPALNMVHVDVGPVRQWTEKSPRKKWVGEKNEQESVVIAVTPDRQFQKQVPHISFDPPSARSEWNPKYTIEFFDRGVWRSGFVEEYGKYRLKFFHQDDPGRYQYSNEFYYKKKIKNLEK